jgi:hypothetical protein
MVNTRRGFLAGILAASFAPAAIGSGVLMPVRKVAAPWFSGELHGLWINGEERYPGFYVDRATMDGNVFVVKKSQFAVVGCSA